MGGGRPGLPGAPGEGGGEARFLGKSFGCKRGEGRGEADASLLPLLFRSRAALGLSSPRLPAGFFSAAYRAMLLFVASLMLPRSICRCTIARLCAFLTADWERMSATWLTKPGDVMFSTSRGRLRGQVKDAIWLGSGLGGEGQQGPGKETSLMWSALSRIRLST